MSARKRHSEFADFMRHYVRSERGGSSIWNFKKTTFWDISNWRRIRELTERGIKNGYLKRTRSPAYRTGTFSVVGMLQRRNYVETTAKGRKYVYDLDRHDPEGVKAPK